MGNRAQIEINRWRTRAVPPGKAAEELTAKELRGALCVEADGDLEHCKKCLRKCLIGRRLLGWPQEKHYTTAGVPEWHRPMEHDTPPETSIPSEQAPSPSRTRRAELQTNPYNRDAYNERRHRDQETKVSDGIAALLDGVKPEDAAHQAGYSSYKAFRHAVKDLGRVDELPDLTNRNRHNSTIERMRDCVRLMLDGAAPIAVATSHGYESVEMMNRMLRRHRLEFVDLCGTDVMFTAKGIVRKESC